MSEFLNLSSPKLTLTWLDSTFHSTFLHSTNSIPHLHWNGELFKATIVLLGTDPGWTFVSPLIWFCQQVWSGPTDIFKLEVTEERRVVHKRLLDDGLITLLCLTHYSFMGLDKWKYRKQFDWFLVSFDQGSGPTHGCFKKEPSFLATALFYLCQIALLHLASLNHPGLTIIWFDSRSYASAYDSFEVKMHETMPNRKSISNIFQARSTSYSDLEVAIEVVLVLVLYLY